MTRRRITDAASTGLVVTHTELDHPDRSDLQALLAEINAQRGE